MPVANRTAIIEQKLDTLLERTIVLEQVVEDVRDIDRIVRGPEKNDGLMTDMLLVKETLRTTANTLRAILVPLVVAFVGSTIGFVWGLITHTITLTIGK